MKTIFTRIAALALIAAPFTLINSVAQATVTDTFVPTGVSWVSVPMADRHYMNELGATGTNGYDDYAVGLVPAGDSCTNNGVTAPAGDMVPMGTGTCTDGSSNGVDGSAMTRIPFDFNVNFFGTT